jgi:hypothetical protein
VRLPQNGIFYFFSGKKHPSETQREIREFKRSKSKKKSSISQEKKGPIKKKKSSISQEKKNKDQSRKNNPQSVKKRKTRTCFFFDRLRMQRRTKGMNIKKNLLANKMALSFYLAAVQCLGVFVCSKIA